MIGHVLYSGSKGNCTYFSDGETSILIDAGGCLKRLRESLCELGVSLEGISGIFVTHEHIDHVKALYNLVKKYNLRIFTSLETARAMCTPNRSYSLEDCRRLASCVMTIKAGKSYEIGTLMISAFATSHDTGESLGFVVRSTHTKKGIGYVTDLGEINEEVIENLKGVKNLVIESNHDVEMLKNGIYPEFLKERILSPRGHLSNDACARAVRFFADNGARSFTLAHLSEENNRPAIAKERIQRELVGVDGVRIKVASAYEKTEIEIL